MSFAIFTQKKERKKERKFANQFSSIGTFFNAIPGLENKERVKQWAWTAYPVAYEDLLKLGQEKIVEDNEDGEREGFYLTRDPLFDIGPIGRDAEA